MCLSGFAMDLGKLFFVISGKVRNFAASFNR